MKRGNLNEMVKGWFVGNFNPTAYRTDTCEVAIKTYSKGEHESVHHHKIATEITVIQQGRVRMSGKEYATGDILVIEPGTATDFEVLEDTVTVVVKVPGAQNDKYMGPAT
jgi:mannose-6-phosphate isomerase-like protein (cupin superfamily)